MPTTNGAAAPAYVIDCDGLVTISQTKNNALRAAAFQLLEQGGMCVPTGVIKELRNAYEDEHDDLLPHIAKKIAIKPAHTARMGSLASKANSGFRIEPYGSADWIVAAVAVCEGCIVVTTKERKSFYTAILTCAIITVEELPVGP
jgi:hypothetical protein